MRETISTYGIIGYPVEHSLSPVMHNAAFQELGVDATYKIFPLQEDELEKFIKDLHDPASPIFGLNVTIPYKEKVIPYLDVLSPFAKRTMAVNTIVISEERELTGYNTDGPGFLAHLAELSFDLKDKRVAVLGAGGTTRSMLAAICVLPEKPNSVLIYNRTVSRAQELVQDLSRRINMEGVEVVETPEELNLELSDCLINTTSVGLKSDDPCPVDPDQLHANLFVYDVIYNPIGTQLLRMAKKKKARTANGLGMLFYQGVLALQHWAGTELDENVKAVMRKRLEEAAGH